MVTQAASCRNYGELAGNLWDGMWQNASVTPGLMQIKPGVCMIDNHVQFKARPMIADWLAATLK